MHGKGSALKHSLRAINVTRSLLTLRINNKGGKTIVADTAVHALKIIS